MPGPSEPASVAPKSTVKFLCSYGGKILPRYPDGKLRYVGGHTRVLAVHRTISFSELMLKLEDLCGSAVRYLRCQLPAEDLDALVSITSDEDLANLIEEYDRAASPLKIRAFLLPPRSPNKASATPPQLPSLSKSAYSSCSSSASASSSSSSSPSSSSSSYLSATGGGHGFGPGRRCKAVAPAVERCVHQILPAAAYPVAGVEKFGGRNIPVARDGYRGQGSTGNVCLIHNGNYWQ